MANVVEDVLKQKPVLKMIFCPQCGDLLLAGAYCMRCQEMKSMTQINRTNLFVKAYNLVFANALIITVVMLPLMGFSILGTAFDIATLSFYENEVEFAFNLIFLYAAFSALILFTGNLLKGNRSKAI